MLLIIRRVAIAMLAVAASPSASSAQDVLRTIWPRRAAKIGVV